MAKLASRRTLWIAAGLVAAALVAWRMFAPESREVAFGTATRGPFTVTVDEDGRTRAVDRWIVTAPVAGTVERLPLRAGEKVHVNDVVARIRPLPLDERTRAQLRAALDAADARRSAAAAALAQAEAAAAQAAREHERRAALAGAGAISAEQLEQYALLARTRREEADAARQTHAAAAADARAARAALLGEADSQGTLAVRAPAAGRIATVPERSSRIVAPGEVIVEITDASALEVVVDVLSSDAVLIRPGMPATLTGWGGDEPIHASVRQVEPAAFTRISALGVEEQRVNVILDLAHRPETLGDGFRVEAAITVWQDDDVISVPSAAVFRAGDGSGWRVFRVAGGRAVLTEVGVAQREGARTRITHGLEPGDTVVLFPPDDLTDGARVKSAS